MATAEGKRTATSLTIGDRVLLTRDEQGNLMPASRLTGDDIITVMVTESAISIGSRRVRFTTSEGEVTAVAHQTFRLAPETPAAVKRAHAEALAVNALRTTIDAGVQAVNEHVEAMTGRTIEPVAEPALTEAQIDAYVAELVDLLIDGCTVKGTDSGWYAAKGAAWRKVLHTVVQHALARGEVIEDPTDNHVIVLRPLAVNDVVTIDPLRQSRQYDVLVTDDLDDTVQVTPRNPRDVDDRPRWIAGEHVHRVRLMDVEAYLDDEDGGDGPETAPDVVTDNGRTFRLGDLVTSEAERGKAMRISRFEWRGGVTPAWYAHLTGPYGGDEILGVYVAYLRPLSSARKAAVAAGHDISVHVCPDPGTAGRWVADCSCGRWMSSPGGRPEVLNAGRAHQGEAAEAPTIADMLLPAMPKQYRDALTHLLPAYGFAAPAGIDVLMPDESNPDAFLIHDPTGVAVGVYERAVRISYPAAHGGAPDEDSGPAWVDLEYGTSIETVVDVAVGLMLRNQPVTDPWAQGPAGEVPTNMPGPAENVEVAARVFDVPAELLHGDLPCGCHSSQRDHTCKERDAGPEFNPMDGI